MPGRDERTVRTTLAVTLIVFISKAAGYVRDMVTAAYFGLGMENDAYVAAYGLFYLPVLLLSSCVTSTLIPLYVDARSNASLKRANQFASNCINLFSAFALLVSAVMMVFARPLVHLIYHGYDGEKLALTVELTRIMMPSLVFVVLSVVLSSILNAREKYIAAQLSGFPLTFAVIGATVLFSGQYGIRAAGWGVFVAGVLQVVIVLSAMRDSLRYSFRFSLNDKRFRKLMALALPAVLSMAVNELNHLIDRSLASGLLTGDMASMNYAYKLISFATGVLIVPVTTIMFSRMSQRAAQHDNRSIIEIVMQCLEVIVLILMPIIAVGTVFSTDVIRLAYQRGNFTLQDALRTAPVFAMYLLGIIGFGLRDLFNRAFHALQNTYITLYVSGLTVALNIVLNIILSRVMGASGLALATTISCMVGAVVLFVLLRRRLGRMGGMRTAIELVKTLIAAVLCALCAVLLNRFLPNADGTLWVFLRLVAATAVSFAVYIMALMALKVRQLAFVRGMIARRR